MADKVANQIMSQVYYSINDAINSTVNTKTVFIIANEQRKKSDGTIGRYYTVFPKFKYFLQNRDAYKHCHEILVDHKNNKLNCAGRLVFDFDIKDVDIPADFTTQIELTIIKVVKKYFVGVDTNLLEYVWSTSANPTKFSKHLTVKNLYFDNWITLSKIFYKLFLSVWKKQFDWIDPNKLIDFQIIRNRASLRMVGSSKLGGYPLEFDDPSFKLTDSLIRIYFKNQRDQEQLVTINNIRQDIQSKLAVTEENSESYSPSADSNFIIGQSHLMQTDPIYPPNVYTASFEMYNKLNPFTFKIGKINGNKMNMIRLKPSNCLLSNKLHECENAFIMINFHDSVYDVRFGCYRYCHPQKTVLIGSLSGNNLLEMFNPNFSIRFSQAAKELRKAQKKNSRKKSPLISKT